MSRKKIKVCGMRDAENIRAVAALGVDMVGFVFSQDIPGHVSMIPSGTGLMPDYAGDTGRGVAEGVGKAGVFADDMPQNIVTCVYNYGLDYVQLDGSESAVMIDNLRRTLDPDIRRGIKIIKKIGVESAGDVMKWRGYEGVADMLLFDVRRGGAADSSVMLFQSVLEAYGGSMPFLLGGDIGPDDARLVAGLEHPMLAGIDVGDRFGMAPAVKDVELLRKFVETVRAADRG